MPYMLAPGARLEVGPGGKMYESMGCDRGCGRGGLGALDKSGNVIGATTTSLKSGRVVALDPRLAASLPGASASGAFFSGSLGPTLILGGVAAAGALYLLTRKKRRR